jgi:ribA/ribD-fused uncharacterized protein
LDDQIFVTNEQFMMYWKAVIFEDWATADAILAGSDMHPAVHKKMGRHVSGFSDALWDKYKVDIVNTATLLKFTQNPKLKELLLSTGDKIIVEASPFDQIWGIGYTKEMALDNAQNWGQNLLGKAIMWARTEIAAGRAEDAIPRAFADIQLRNRMSRTAPASNDGPKRSSLRID